MSDDSYHPEIEKEQLENVENEYNPSYLSSISKEINNELPLPEIHIDYDVFQPSIQTKGIKGIRRQKSLQFVTTEMIFLMMRQLKNNGSSTLNPSTIANDLNITRRRIYDIIHVFSCLKLITRITYCDYSWNGIKAMQEYLTQLYAIPFEQFDTYCKNNIPTSKKQDSHDCIDEGTTKHVTILSLKYLFLYIKSGRKTFNNHDITSLLLKDIHLPVVSRKAIKDREKSIERRLYDVISVFCGLGLVKRKTDAITWTVEESDTKAELENTRVSYNKGLNMMIEIEYCIFPLKNGIPNILPNSLLSIWEYLFSIYQKQHVVIAIDIEYLLQQNLPQIVEDNNIVLNVPSVYSINPCTQVSAVVLELQKEILKPSVTALVNQQLTLEEGKSRRKRKSCKRSKKDNESDDDDDWQIRPRKKRNNKKKSIEGDLFNDNDFNWKESVSQLSDNLSIPSPIIEPVQIQTPPRDFIDIFPQTPYCNISPIQQFNMNQLISPLSNTLPLSVSPAQINDKYSSIAIPTIDFLLSPQSSSMNQQIIPNIPEFSENATLTLPPLPELPTVYTSEEQAAPSIKKEISISPANVLDPNLSNTKTVI